tara:strand:- start:676 stop:3735 length:3060 start_codon:yes stop_codon:yes gene_type:complete
MFRWFEKILIKLAKKILNKHAPKGEFLAYINKREEKLLKQYGGAGLEVKKTKIKSFFSIGAIFSAVASFFATVNPIVAIVVTVAVAWVMRPKVPDLPDFGLNEADEFETGILLNKQSNDSNIPVIYGERLVGGTRVFLDSGGGNTNQYLYMAIVMAEGEINSIEEVRIDEKVVTWASALSDGTEVEVNSSDSNFYKADPNVEGSSAESLIRIEPHFGTDGQSASGILSALSNWGSNHKLSGLCYLALRFKWNQDAFSGIPKVQAKIKGKKVRTYNSSLVEQSASFQTNPAWCLLDYLTNARYGKGLAVSEIDLQSFYDASQVCETQVTPYSGGSDINIFDTNAVIDTSKKLLENVRELLKGCRGYLPYTQGKYNLIIETTGTASITLTEDDIIGGYTLTTPAKNEKYNRVIVSYVEPSRNFQVDEVQFPPINDSGLPSADRHTTMKTDDGGFLLEGRFDFGKVITNKYQAEEMAEIILRRTRDAVRLSINVSFSAYDLAIGDIVNVTHSSLGYSAKPFRILSIKFNSDFTLGLDLVEHQNSHYTWTSKDEIPAIPSTNLPNPFTIQPPAGITLSDDLVEYNDGTVITRLSVSVSASPDKFVDQYQVEVKQLTDRNGNAVTDTFKTIGKGSSLNYQLLNVIDNAQYQVRCKAINGLGVSSTFVTDTRQIVGQTAVPSDVEDFAINVIGNQALLSWTAIPDLDLDFYTVRFSTDLSNPSWANSFDLVTRVGRPATNITVPLKTGSYLIKANDKLGNQSANETIISTNIASTDFVSQTTINEHTAFTGTKTNSSVITRNSTNFLGLTATGTVGESSTTVPASGTYEFANSIDLGAKFKGQFSASVTQLTEDVSENFDSGRPTASTLFDDGRPNPFDGTSPAKAHTILQIATSDDNSTFSNFNQFVTGEHIGRYFKFRVKLTSDDQKARSLISSLSVTASLSKRTESGNDISSGTGGKTVTYDFGFKLNPAIGISAQSMNTGDYYSITSKSTTQFTIEFFNSSGTSIDRTFDYIAQGVGQVIV